MNKKKILIAGGGGFVGTNLIANLNDNIYDIKVIDNFSSSSEKIFRKNIFNFLNKKVKIKKIDLLNFYNCKKEIKNSNYVIHLAAESGVEISIKKPLKTFKQNIVVTQNLLEASRLNKIEKFVYASSSASVGEGRPPLNEKKLINPIHPYGAHKASSEALCNAYLNCFGLKTTSLRFSNVFGPFFYNKISVVSKMIKDSYSQGKIYIEGNGLQTRDFLHADDLSKAIIQILKKRNNIEGIFQLASSKEVSILNLAKTIQKVFLKYRNKVVDIKFKKSRKGDIKRSYSSIKKIKNHLNWKPLKKVNEENLKKLLEYYESTKKN